MNPAENAAPRPLRPYGTWAARAGLALLPFATLGLLCPVPSLVIALRRRRSADWAAFAVFGAVWVSWVIQLATTPDTTHGTRFAADVLLIGLSTAGAAAHAWRAWPAARKSPNENGESA
ncbi:hypothetical protein AB0M57_03790 [Streptomyces sp. NPDC051597]|uniref:hypothetical protein n=1 Tax=Streptomyces sp. NPDC051597 TaxID=3155049 RepID=UPI003440C0E4